MSDKRTIGVLSELPRDVYDMLCLVTMNLSGVLAKAAMESAHLVRQGGKAETLTNHVADETIAAISLTKAVSAVVINTYPVGGERAGIESAIAELRALLADMDDTTNDVSVFLEKKRTRASREAGGLQ